MIYTVMEVAFFTVKYTVTSEILSLAELLQARVSNI